MLDTIAVMLGGGLLFGAGVWVGARLVWRVTGHTGSVGVLATKRPSKGDKPQRTQTMGDGVDQ